MKAIVYERYGPPEVLRVAEVAAPKPGKGQVLLRVRACEVTKADCELRAFRFAVSWFWLPLRLAIGVFRPRKRILGVYLAGEVAAVGEGAEGFAVGDRVFGSAGLEGMGGYGEFVAVPAEATLLPMPSNRTFAEAAAVPLGGLNALHFLRRARIQAGESVLILGAGGSIGLHAVQIAKAMGAVVTAVDKGVKEEVVRRMGADHFVDYTCQDFAADGARFDVVFDMVPSSSFVRCLGVLTETGRYLCGNPRLAVMLGCAWTNRFSRRRASFAFARETREELQALREMIEAGQVRSIVDRVVSPEEIVDAHRRVESEERLGAVVLEMD